MSTDAPLYERDRDAWRTHLAQGNATQPRKRVSADVVLRDQAGRLLLVDPTYKPNWDVPGGMAEANEPPREAAKRELKEELGLDIDLGEMLCVDWVSPHEPWDDLLAFVFEGGRLSDDHAAGLTILDSELAGFAWCDEIEARQRLRPYVWRRASAALEALKTGQARYLQDGYLR